MRTLQQLIRDTFRQARASGISWMMLGVTTICVLVCLSVSVAGDASLFGGEEPPLFLPGPAPRALAPSVISALGASSTLDSLGLLAAGGREWFAFEKNPNLARREGVDIISGHMTVAFGAIPISLFRERRDAVHFLELLLAAGMAGTIGLLLALVWTGGFLPSFLEPGAASVLLAKPTARWQLLFGKYLGVVSFVAYEVTLFIVLTWLALGVRTGVWDLGYWYSIPLLVLQFAIFYSFSVLLAVLTRSTVSCVFGCVLYWLLAWGINYGDLMVRNLADNQSLPPFTAKLADAAYWISPKPIDAGLIFFNALGAERDFMKPETFKLVEAKRSFSATLSILSCLGITAVLLALSAHEFKSTDY